MLGVFFKTMVVLFITRLGLEMTEQFFMQHHAKRLICSVWLPLLNCTIQWPNLGMCANGFSCCSWIFARLAVFPPFFWILWKTQDQIQYITPLSTFLSEWLCRA